MYNPSIHIYADGANLADMTAAYQEGIVKGFTTNPTLMRKSGVKDYLAFLRDAAAAIPDLPLSVEVFADDFPTMKREAQVLSSYGKNIFVKIPILNIDGESSVPLIGELSGLGVPLNVTAVMSLTQVREAVEAFAPGTRNIVSVFAGRIADTGTDPVPVMREAAALCHAKPDVRLLWASSREILNVLQAEACGADIITLTYDLLKKLPMLGRDYQTLSPEIVQMFSRDAHSLGFRILP